MYLKHALALSAFIASGASIAQQCPAGAQTLTYPGSKKVDQTDDYHGVKVADPYRWLENANGDDTKAWVDAQNKLTQSYLETIPARTAIRERLTKLWNYERFSVPFKEGGRYFYSRNDGLQNQAVFIHRQTDQRRTAPAAGSEHAGSRWHGSPSRHCGQPEW